MKNTIIFMLLGALTGVFIAAWVVPPALAWYTSPGGLPQGAQIQAVVQIPEVIRYATTKLIRWQMIAGCMGAALGLALGAVLNSRNRTRRAQSTTPVTSDTTPRTT